MVLLTVCVFVGCENFNVDVTLDSIKVTTKPSNVQIIGKPLDTTSMVVTGYYKNGFGSVISEYTITPSILTAETTEVIVSYKEKTDRFPVTVYENTVQSIDIKRLPAKMSYYNGEELDTTGIIVEKTLLDGTVVETTDYTLSQTTPFDSLGEKTITVTYTEGDIEKFG